MPKKIRIDASMMGSLSEIAIGQAISNTKMRALAKLGWIRIHGETKVLDGHEQRKIYRVSLTQAGRGALNASKITKISDQDTEADVETVEIFRNQR